MCFCMLLGVDIGFHMVGCVDIGRRRAYHLDPAQPPPPLVLHAQGLVVELQGSKALCVGFVDLLLQRLGRNRGL